MRPHAKFRPTTRSGRPWLLVVVCLLGAGGCKTIDDLAHRVVSDLLGQLQVQARDDDYPIRLCVLPPVINGAEHLPPDVQSEKCRVAMQTGMEMAIAEFCARPECRNRIKLIPLSLTKVIDPYKAMMMAQDWDSTGYHDRGAPRPTMAVSSEVRFGPKQVDIAAQVYRLRKGEPWQQVVASFYRGEVGRQGMGELRKMRQPGGEAPAPGVPFGLDLPPAVQKLLVIGDAELERGGADPEIVRRAERKAMECYQAVRKQVGDHPAVLLRIAYVYAFGESQFDPERAQRLYLSVANSDRCCMADRVKAMVNLAVMCERQGRSAEAEEWLLKASDYDEDNVYVLLNRGHMAYRRGDNAKREELLRRAVDMARTSAPPLVGYALGKWGVALYEVGKAQQAKDALLEAATDHGIRYARDASYNLAILHMSEGDAQAAIARLEKLHQASPNDHEVLLALGVAHADAQQWGKARLWLEKAIECKPSAPEPYLRLAWLLYNVPDYDRAEVMLEAYRNRLLPGQKRSHDAQRLEGLLADRRDSGP